MRTHFRTLIFGLFGKAEVGACALVFANFFGCASAGQEHSATTGASGATAGATVSAVAGGMPAAAVSGKGGSTGAAASPGSTARGGAGAPAAVGGGRSGAGSPSISGGAGASGSVASAGMSGGADTSAGTGAGGSAGSAGSNSADACSIPKLDSAMPPKALMLSGNLGTHDPVVIEAGGTYYLFATGNGISAKTSTDLREWKAAPDVFPRIPSWVAGKLSGVTNIWAPDISFFGGLYHLYYAVSTFGSNKSCIGHATRSDMKSGSWSDQGEVICSNNGSNDDWNAIDPNIIVDPTGTPWMALGSFWSGIKLIKLDASGKRADTKVIGLAKFKSIEGAFIVHQCGYYYLFVSFGACCGDPYDYNIRVGRSKDVSGPYVDKAGMAMMDGGGTQIVKGNGTWTAPGHNAVLITPAGTYNIYHALNASHANATLRIAELVLDADGWPVSGGP
jgi:arabinan endo-1,5-alpha-L-arabinosidase